MLAEKEKSVKQAMHIVWADPSDNEYAVYYSSRSKDGWSPALKISDNDRLNITPAITIHHNDDTWPNGDIWPKSDIWVVWSVMNGTDIHLYYKKFSNNEWSQETKFDTGMKSNTSPTVAVDGAGILWLVWAGNNGQNDEIYYSRWKKGEFDYPRKITDNKVPDVLPILSIDGQSAMPRIDWIQACDSGNCAYHTQWSESGWSDITRSGAGKIVGGEMRTKELGEKTIEVPSFVKTPQSISVFIEGESIQSLPLRLTNGN